MAVPVHPLADGLIAALVLAGILIVILTGGDSWKFGLAVIGLALFLLAGLTGEGGGA